MGVATAVFCWFGLDANGVGGMAERTAPDIDFFGWVVFKDALEGWADGASEVGGNPDKKTPLMFVGRIAGILKNCAVLSKQE